MNTATSHLVAQLVELRLNREDADVILKCEGEVIKAHSFILGMRYKENTLLYLYITYIYIYILYSYISLEVRGPSGPQLPVSGHSDF